MSSVCGTGGKEALSRRTDCTTSQYLNDQGVSPVRHPCGVLPHSQTIPMACLPSNLPLDLRSIPPDPDRACCGVEACWNAAQKPYFRRNCRSRPSGTLFLWFIGATDCAIRSPIGRPNGSERSLMRRPGATVGDRLWQSGAKCVASLSRERAFGTRARTRSLRFASDTRLS